MRDRIEVKTFFRDHYKFARKNSEIRDRFEVKIFFLALARGGPRNLNPPPARKVWGPLIYGVNSESAVEIVFVLRTTTHSEFYTTYLDRNLLELDKFNLILRPLIP